MSILTAICVREYYTLQNIFKKYTSRYSFFNVERIRRNYALPFYELTWISVHLDESEAMKLHDLDEIDKNLTLNPSTLLEQLALVSAKSKIERNMNAHEFFDYELEFDEVDNVW